MKLLQPKLKHALTGLALVALSNSNLNAQGAYVNVNVGYGMSLNGQKDILFNTSNTYSFNEQTSEYVSTDTQETVNLSLGKGLNFGASFGYMFNKNLGAELGFNYLLGGATEGADTYHSTYIDLNGVSTTSSDKFTSKFSSNMFQINPSIVLASGFEKWNPYAKFGVVLGFGSVITDMQYSNSNGENASYQLTNNGGMAFGVSGSFGTQYALNDKLSLFGELNLISMSYSPTKGEITEYVENGQDMLPTLTDNEKKIEYVDEITTTNGTNFPYNPDAPNQEFKTAYQFSSIGLKVGLTFHF